MKIFSFLAIFAFFVLSVAAIWMGGLNQDEGWYLYAAQMIRDGYRLYADFAFTQGPIFPTVYSVLCPLWSNGGLLAARILTLAIGLLAILFFSATAHLIANEENKKSVAITTFILLANNLYHLYYLAIPKTYALATLFVAMGFFLLAFAMKFATSSRMRAIAFFATGLTFAFATATRISLAPLLAITGLFLLATFRYSRFAFLWFGLGGFFALAISYAPYLLNQEAFDGLRAAQAYHLARDGFNPTLAIGSLSRLVRWYLPIFIILGLAIASFFATKSSARDKSHFATKFLIFTLIANFVAIFAIHLFAPNPYEDYQVPIMPLLAIVATLFLFATPFIASREKQFAVPLLAIGLTWAGSFGSPLLESWSCDGQDRFWTRVKEKTELAHLRDVAKEINTIDPNGKNLLTQDLYLAIETKRKVPRGLEMGPFSILSDDEWRRLLSSAPTEIAALSGYTFAINPPSCKERSIEQQTEFWRILKSRYNLVLKEEAFGQHATTLLILKRKENESK